MKRLVFLENFNNYYNREIKRYDTEEDYTKKSTSYQAIEVNFIPNDNLATEQIINTQSWASTFNPDYCLVENANSTIEQRWFVIDSSRTTMGQYVLTLKRDVVADYYYETINAPCFIEKATVPDDNPLIYNRENFAVNEIKQSESLLKDETNTPWIVGYMSGGTMNFENTSGLIKEGDTYYISIPSESAYGATSISSFDSAPGSAYWDINGTGISKDGFNPVVPMKNLQENTTAIFDVFFETTDRFGVVRNNDANLCMSIGAYSERNKNMPGSMRRDFYSLLNDAISENIITSTISTYLYSGGITEYDSPKIGEYGWGLAQNKLSDDSGELATAFCNCRNSIASNWNYLINKDSYGSNILGVNVGTDSTNNLNTLRNEIGKKYLKDGFLYEVKELKQKYGVKKRIGIPVDSTFYTNVLSDLKTLLKDFIKNPEKAGYTVELVNIDGFNHLFYISYYYNEYSLLVEKIKVGERRAYIPGSPKKLNDAPYRMFAIPYGDFYYYSSGDQSHEYRTKVTSNPALAIAMEMSRVFSGSGWLYDIQILPYCPFRKGIYNYAMDLTNLIRNTDYSGITITNGTTTSDESFIFWCDSATDSFTINYEIPIIEKKVQNQCDFIRVCSPNYNGVFQFNPAMNDGMDYFNVEFTYKPYNPFIHIAPNFKGIYGSDFKDNRGLILGGDFSLPQVNDAWTTYELNNKNYQNSFNREIQYMDKMHSIDMAQRNFAIATGIVGSTLSGAGQGAQVAGGYGAIGGAVLGAATGVAGMAGNMIKAHIAEITYNEGLDYRKDLFGMNLQNIQALSQSISKTTALVANHKLFPFVEHYSCTTEEKEAFRQKIKWDGMTVGAISNSGIVEYMLPDKKVVEENADGIFSWYERDLSYIKGSIIKIEIPEDTHIAVEIANEIFKGVRI